LPSCIYLTTYFFFTATPSTLIYTLSLHDALPICVDLHDLLHRYRSFLGVPCPGDGIDESASPHLIYLFKKYFGYDPNKSKQENRSEEHTSELQSRFDLVCRLLLEKKKE